MLNIKNPYARYKKQADSPRLSGILCGGLVTELSPATITTFFKEGQQRIRKTFIFLRMPLYLRNFELKNKPKTVKKYLKIYVYEVLNRRKFAW